jgi:hypothetical protein
MPTQTPPHSLRSSPTTTPKFRFLYFICVSRSFEIAKMDIWIFGNLEKTPFPRNPQNPQFPHYGDIEDFGDIVFLFTMKKSN